MSASVYPFILSRIAELEPQKAQATTRTYTGRDLVQLRKFHTYRNIHDPEDKTVLLATASDGHYKFSIMFDLEATIQMEKRMKETVTSNVRCLFALKQYHLELLPPILASSSRQAQPVENGLPFSNKSKAHLFLHATSFEIVHGSPNEPVYHPQAPDISFSSDREEEQGQIEFPDLPHLKVEELARWRRESERAVRASERWLNRLSNLSKGIIEEEEEERKPVVINISQEVFARPSKISKIEPGSLGNEAEEGIPTDATTVTLRQLKKPSSRPMDIIETLTPILLEGEDMDYAFRMSHPSVPDPSNPPDRIQLEILEKQMRLDLLNNTRSRPDKAEMIRREKEKDVVVIWGHEDALQGRRDGWLEKWMRYEDGEEDGGVMMESENEEMDGVATMGKEEKEMKEGLEESRGRTPVKEEGEKVIPWSTSPVARGIRNSNARSASPMAEVDVGDERGNIDQADGPIEQTHVIAADGLGSGDRVEGNENDDDEPQSSLEIRQPDIISRRHFTQGPSNTQARPVLFKDLPPSSSLSSLGSQEAGAEEKGNERSAADRYGLDQLNEEESMMVCTQAYMLERPGMNDGADDEVESWDSGEGVASQDEGEPIHGEAAGAILADPDQGETQTSDEVMKESLEDDGQEIFSSRGGTSQALAVRSSPMQVDQEEKSGEVTPRRESCLIDQDVPRSQAKSSVLAEESDEETSSRSRIRKDRTPVARRNPNALPKIVGSGSDRLVDSKMRLDKPGESSKAGDRRKRSADEACVREEDARNLPMMHVKVKKAKRMSSEGTTRVKPVPLKLAGRTVSLGIPARPDKDAGPHTSSPTTAATIEGASGTGRKTKKTRDGKSRWPKKLEIALDPDEGLSMDDLID